MPSATVQPALACSPEPPQPPWVQSHPTATLHMALKSIFPNARPTLQRLSLCAFLLRTRPPVPRSHMPALCHVLGTAVHEAEQAGSPGAVTCQQGQTTSTQNHTTGSIPAPHPCVTGARNAQPGSDGERASDRPKPRHMPQKNWPVHPKQGRTTLHGRRHEGRDSGRQRQARSRAFFCYKEITRQEAASE